MSLCNAAFPAMGDTRPGCYGFAMNSSEGATALLNGPRGRRLCLALVDAARLSYLGTFHRNDDEPALRSLARELEAAISATHDWWRATGLASAWLIPDWVAVASDYDAVHLTVNGYLTTAGRALPVVDSCRTVLAGWDPDQTIWLTDILTGSGAPTEWDVDQAGHVRVIAGPST